MRYVIACIVAIAMGVPIVAYTERSRVSDDIEAVLHEWAATWNISDAQERVAARNKLTCARSQARQSNSQLAAPRKVVPDTDIDMQRGLTASPRSESDRRCGPPTPEPPLPQPLRPTHPTTTAEHGVSVILSASNSPKKPVDGKSATGTRT